MDFARIGVIAVAVKGCARILINAEAAVNIASRDGGFANVVRVLRGGLLEGAPRELLDPFTVRSSSSDAVLEVLKMATDGHLGQVTIVGLHAPVLSARRAGSPTAS
jgi:hypothetical protein